MSFRKHPPTANPWTETDKYSTKSKETTSMITFGNRQFRSPLSLVAFLSTWCLLLFFWFWVTEPLYKALHHNNTTTTTTADNDGKLKKIMTTKSTVSVPTCDANVSVYVYELPAEFNLGLLKDCRHLNVYTDMCPHVANSGLGQPLPDMNNMNMKMNMMGSASPTTVTTSWFATHQFIAEMIFHARVENHPCRTWDPSRANLFYVPFYGGLHASSKFREGNLTARDELAIKLVKYLRRQHKQWWKRHQGQDHFLALGRTAWDFMRTTSTGPDFGANSLLNMQSVLNMSVLTVERHPWQGSNQYGIPYPSYFHPHTSYQMLTWQHQMRQSQRSHLFSFIGGPRKGVEKAAIRDEIMRQCAQSTWCELLKCGQGASRCHQPSVVLQVMTRSQFCLQAPGDSFTRRSTFDSVLAGCIPVFFSPHTAYSQYAWFFPTDPTTYSVYIDGEANVNATQLRIEEELLKIPKDAIERMRSTVIDLIPKITYVHPNASHYQFPDAVDVALAALSKHVHSKLQLQTQKR